MSEGTNHMVTVTIDGQTVTVPHGTTIIEAARRIGIEIPHYCYDKDLSIVASCRLCLVEIEKVPKLQPSCSTPVADGQKIYTQSESVLDARRMQMEFLLVQHPLDCPVCDQGGECKLQDYSMNHGFGASRFRFPKRTFHKPDIGPFIDLERNRCILCSRCVRFMDEIAGDAELAIVQRGNKSMISTFMENPLKNEFAGNTIDLCPVGALTSRITRFRARVWELKDIPSLCSLCSVGCNVHAQYRDRTHEILRVLPRQNEEVNYRWICDIGRFGFDRFNSSERQRTPLAKNSEGKLEAASWAKTIRQTVSTLKETIAAHGASSVAGIISPKPGNETLFLFQQFFRELLQSNNVDHRTETIIRGNDDGFLTAIALKAANQPFREVKQSAAVLLIGTDLPNELPILYLQVRKKAVSGASVFSLHHRPTRLDKDCAAALTYRPGAEAALITVLLAMVVRSKKVELPKKLRQVIKRLDVKKTLEPTGLQEQDLRNIIDKLLQSERATILVGESIYATADGVGYIKQIAHLAGGLPGANEPTLPFSLLLPHNNSRGAADMGCYPHRGPGYTPVEKAGLNTTRILQGCIDGSIHALLLMNTDLLNEYPDRDLVRKALETVPFLAVADVYRYETSEFASVFFPLSAFSEEDGTYTNLAGRVQLTQKVLPQLEGTLAGYQMLLALGEQWGAGWRQIRPPLIFDNITKAVPHYRELHWDELRGNGQPSKEIDNELFDETRQEFALNLPQTGNRPKAYPFRLVRGRFLFDQAGEKCFAPALVDRSEPCTVEIHPADAKKLGVETGAMVTITGKKGSMQLPCAVSLAAVEGSVTILGNYTGIAVNGLADADAPWVNIQP